MKFFTFLTFSILFSLNSFSFTCKKLDERDVVKTPRALDSMFGLKRYMLVKSNGVTVSTYTTSENCFRASVSCKSLNLGTRAVPASSNSRDGSVSQRYETDYAYIVRTIDGAIASHKFSEKSHCNAYLKNLSLSIIKSFAK
jgi:hypothetical protein